MVQQINLFTPILLTRRKSFSSRTMALALVVFLCLVGLLCWYGLTTLRSATDLARRELVSREAEKIKLKQAIATRATVFGSMQQGLAKETRQVSDDLLLRQQLLMELSRGLSTAENSHSERLRLVAQTIPPTAWITTLSADGPHLEIRGQTTQPESLNGWMARLLQSKTLQGQVFSIIQVDTHKVESGASDSPSGMPSPLWDFFLSSQVVANVVTTGGGRP